MEMMLNKFCAKYKLPVRLLKEELLPHMIEVHFEKGDFIIQEGERNTNFYLVKEGIWRGYHLANGTENSLWFASSGEVVFSSWGYMEDKPSLINVEALNVSSAYCINRTELENIYSNSVEMANFGRKIFEREFLAINNATLAYNTPPTARERYLTLIEENPELLQDVPLKHLASYLYITPQSLSRIRAGLKKK